MKKRGFDPSMCRKSTTQPADVRLTASDEERGTDDVPIKGIQPDSHQCDAPKTGDDRQSGGGYDRELPPSTPAPPPLNIPIVTHGRTTSEGRTNHTQCQHCS